MTETVRDLGGMVEVFRARNQELGITYETVDHLAGLAPGYCAKLMCGMKRLGPVTVSSLCGALAMGFVPVVDEDQAAKVQGRWEPRKRPVFPTKATYRQLLLAPPQPRPGGALLATDAAAMLPETKGDDQLCQNANPSR